MDLVGPNQISSEDVESVCKGSLWDDASSPGEISSHGLSEHCWQHGPAERHPAIPGSGGRAAPVLRPFPAAPSCWLPLEVVALVAAPAGPCSH